MSKIIKHSNFLVGLKKKMKGLTEAAPWLVELYLAHTGIDENGQGGERGLLEFTPILPGELISKRFYLFTFWNWVLGLNHGIHKD